MSSSSIKSEVAKLSEELNKIKTLLNNNRLKNNPSTPETTDVLIQEEENVFDIAGAANNSNDMSIASIEEVMADNLNSEDDNLN